MATRVTRICSRVARWSGQTRFGCADITYIQLAQRFVYLAVVLDVFTRSIRGWYLGRYLSGDLVRNALNQALATRRPEIHHSDQGVQYAATGYTERLQASGIQISMAAVGQPTDNPYCRAGHSHHQKEEVYLNEYRDLADARAHLGRLHRRGVSSQAHPLGAGLPDAAEFETQWWQTRQPSQMLRVGNQ